MMMSDASNRSHCSRVRCQSQVASFHLSFFFLYVTKTDVKFERAGFGKEIESYLCWIG